MVERMLLEETSDNETANNYTPKAGKVIPF